MIKKALEYAEQFERLFEEFDKVANYLELEETERSYIEKKRKWIDYLKSPQFPIAFLGTFSTGKSTIINAILERTFFQKIRVHRRLFQQK